MKDHATLCFAAFLVAALALPSCLPAASSTDALPLVPWPRSVDEPHDSWWAGPAPQWLRVDLRDVFRVDRIRVFPYWDGSRSYRYTVEVSEDGEAWKAVVDRRENTAAARPEGDDFRFPVERVRHVRVNMLGNTANEGVHLVEVEVFEAKGR
jgi:hypothetical protein